MKRKTKPAPAQAQAEARRKAAQEWMPVRDVAGGVLVRRDGAVAAVVRVEPLNLALKSEAEKKRIIGAVHEALNGLRDQIQILSLGRPVDLDAYLRGLEERARDADGRRRDLLRAYTRYVAGLAAGGEALERRFYLIVPAAGKQAREEALARARELAGDLGRAGLTARVCEDAEIIDMLFVWSHPAQAAYERPPERPGPWIPTQLAGGGG